MFWVEGKEVAKIEYVISLYLFFLTVSNTVLVDETFC